MRGTEIETVTLDENIDHPLDAVLAQVDRGKAGPVMIVGLERSNPSSAKERPVLYALNMSRPEWPKALPRPLVFWVPEYLLGLMGREAPDFLDWRSDTLFFSESIGDDLLPLTSDVWLGGTNEFMTERQRRDRIKELRARLASHADSDDPVLLSARASWLQELGVLLFRLGELISAREILLAAIEAERRLGREGNIADNLGNLALVEADLGREGEAARIFEEVLKIHEKMGNEYAEARSLVNLASLQLSSAHLDSAEHFGRRALELAEKLDDRSVIAHVYSILLGIALGRRDLQAAKQLGDKALAVTADTGSLFSRSEILRQLGLLSSLEGDYNRADRYFKESIEIAKVVGAPVFVARTLLAVGVLNIRQGNWAAARKFLLEAKGIFQEIGNIEGAEWGDDLLRNLDTPPG